MKIKAKKFSHKLLALFMAVIMALTCFSGALSAFAASSDVKFTDNDVEYNDLAWPVLSDEQVATAILDFADEMLKEYLLPIEGQLGSLLGGLDIPVVSFNHNTSSRQVEVKALGSTWVRVTVKLGSVDELMETIESANEALHGTLLNLIQNFGLDLGIIPDLDFSATKGLRRGTNTSCEIVRGVLGLIYENADLVVGGLLRGNLPLGVIPLDVFDTIGNLFGAPDGYESNFVYNVVQSLLFNNTQWFTDAEKADYLAHPETFKFDTVLLEKMTTELLDKINVLVTYPDGTNSGTRKAAIEAKMASDNLSFADASKALGYDPNLIYSSERGQENNILLFAYGEEKIQLKPEDSLFSFGYQALKMAWKTVLQDTVKLLHVNYDVDRGHGSNFDNQYMYWVNDNLEGGWNVNDLDAMYSKTNVENWANDVYASYDAESPEEFLEWVKHNFEYDRGIVDNATGTWRDVNPNTLINKIRYSPLADRYFDIQTGPINLYFMQLGTANLDEFFDTKYSTYSSLAAGLNDALVAAVKDIFVDSKNVYIDEPGDINVPAIAETGNFTTIDDYAIRRITETLTSNALAIVQYVADTMDQNILAAFYAENGSGAKLTEQNIEKAMIPLLIAAIGQINLGSGALKDIIHPEDWDAAKDAEAIAFIALREYLSYVLPNNDYNGYVERKEDENQTIVATLDGTILPMARDAIIYIIESAVQVKGKDGKIWKAEDPDHDKDADIFDLLNNVICQFADYYSYSKDIPGKAYGVAPLLGLCETNGDSTVNTGKTIWENIDTVFNHLLPILGELQGKGKGNLDSKELIWDDIVKGILEIGDIHTSGFGGVSNFIYRLLTIVSSAPIQSERIIDVVYDFVADFFNALLGSRDGNKTPVFPVRASGDLNPFDSLLQKDTIAPAVVKAIQNFVSYTGYKGTDTVLPALMFALNTVNNYVDFLPSIADHKLNLATAEYSNSVVEGAKTGNAYSSTITFTNNSTGVNVAYVDGINDSVKQLSRYYMRVTSATVVGNNGATVEVSGLNTSALIAPGQSMSVTVNPTFTAAAGGSDCLYTATFNYQVTDAGGTVLYDGLVARAYQYMTGAATWRTSIYPASDGTDSSRAGDGLYWFPSSVETVSQNATNSVNGFNVKSTARFAATTASINRWIANYPEYVVVDTSKLDEVGMYGVRLINDRSVGGSTRSIDGIYFYDVKTVYNDGSNGNVNVNANNAIPVFDKTNGDLLKYGLYDYSTDGGQNWERNYGSMAAGDSTVYGYRGFTQAEIESKMNEVDEKDLVNFKTRTHVAYTFQEALDAKIIAAYHVNTTTKLYDYVYMATGNGTNYDTTLNFVSMRGPIEGFYLNTGKITVDTNKSTYLSFINYDGTTEITGTTEEIPVNLRFYTSGDGSATGVATIKYVCADTTSSATGVQEKYDELSSILANYKDTDFTSPAVLTAAQEALEKALATLAIPITPTSALELNDKTERTFVTATSTSVTGDAAMRPAKAADTDIIPSDIIQVADFDDETGIWYYDTDHVSPIYVDEPLQAADVRGDKDIAGVPVTLVNGVYYYTNSIAYEKAWDTSTFDTPWYRDTYDQATDGSGNKLYNQMQFTHYNSNGQNVRYVDDWVVAIPQSSYQRIPSTVGQDNRGTYTKVNEYLDYTMEYVRSNINTAFAAQLLEQVSEVRYGLNANNFEVVTYNKMVEMGQTIESQYSIDITYTKQEAVIGEDGQVSYDPEGNVVTEPVEYTDTISFSDLHGYLDDPANSNISYTAYSSLSSVQVDEYLRLFGIFMNAVVERGYNGYQLEAEVKCASGNTYDNLSATPATYSEDGELLTNAVVKNNGGDAPRFGAWSEDGTLVNEGDPIYTEDTWTAYVNALADAVALAQHGNTDYVHANKAYYVASDKEGYDAQVTDVYRVDTALQRAEIALEPIEDEGHTVTGTLVIATNSRGATNNVAVYGDYTVTVYDAATDAEVLTQTFEMRRVDGDNTFELFLPSGSYYAVITSDYSIERKDITITVGDADITGPVIPIIACDFNQDGDVTVLDATTVYAQASGAQAPYCDLNGDGDVTVLDATIVYTCASSTPALPAIVIE